MALPLAVGIDGSETGLEVDLATADAARHRLSLHLVHAAAGDREPSDVISAASERAGGEIPGCSCQARCCMRAPPLPSSTPKCGAAG